MPKEKKEYTKTPIVTKKPDIPCWNCKREKWWQRPDGGWVCEICYPNPDKQRLAMPSDNFA